MEKLYGLDITVNLDNGKETKFNYNPCGVTCDEVHRAITNMLAMEHVSSLVIIASFKQKI